MGASLAYDRLAHIESAVRDAARRTRPITPRAIATELAAVGLGTPRAPSWAVDDSTSTAERLARSEPRRRDRGRRSLLEEELVALYRAALPALPGCEDRDDRRDDPRVPFTASAHPSARDWRRGNLENHRRRERSMPFNNIGPMELIIVLVIALLVIGPKKLPEVGKSLGRGMREFKESISGEHRDDDDDLSTSRHPTPPGQITLRISRQLLDDIVEHARAEAPHQCCGMIASRDGEAVTVHRAAQLAASALRYVDGPDGAVRSSRTRSTRRAWTSARSTTRTRARTPSPRETDINLAKLGDTDAPAFPGTLYLIVGVKGPEDDLRLWSIVGNTVEQVELQVTD